MRKIQITFKTGAMCTWQEGEEWDYYTYDGNALILKKGTDVVGVYNFDCLLCFVVK